MSWTAVASLPEALTAPACAEHGGKLYAFGGDATQTHAYVYDPGTNTWTAIANVTTGGFVNTAVAFGLSDGNIYIVDVGSPRNFTKYDPVANTYSAPTAPPQSWVGAGACSDGSLIYFLEYPSGSTNQLPQVSVYDPTTDTWSSTGTTCPGAIAPHGLASGSCFLLGTEIWYFNGWPNAATSPDGVVVKYDIATDTWSAAGTTEPAPNRMNGVPTLSGVDFPPIIGGEDASLIYDTVDLWDGAAWSSYAVLPVATTVAGGAVVGSNVYVVGGYTTGPVASVYRAPLADFTATTTTVNTGLVTGRTARGFYAHFGPVAAAAMHAGRVARGFALTPLTVVATAGGRPDADTATGWQRLDRDFTVATDVEPPVDPPPAASPVRFYKRRSYSYPAPTFNADGWSHPKQTRTRIDTSDVGRHRIKIGGVDRTYYRGVPVRLLEDSHANPFGPELAVLYFPQITPFEHPGSGAIAWLHDGAKVVLQIVKPDGSVDTGWSWVGYIHDIRPTITADAFGFTVEAKGFLYEGDDTNNKPLPINRGADLVPIGYRVADVLNGIEGRRFPRIARVDTSPATTRSRGSIAQNVLGFVRDLFAQAWTSDGRQWTLLDTGSGSTAAVVLPDPSTVDYTISVGQDGVTFDLDEENDELPNVVYGEWVDPNGGRHQRLKFPRLHEDRSPTYPLSVGAVFNPGSGTTGFQAFSDWMRRNGFSGFDSQDTYLASDEDDVMEAQERMGITVDGIVGAQTWGTAFNTGADVGDLFNAIYLPIAADPRVMRFLYTQDGTRLGRNPAYDPTVRRKETYLNFGEGLTYRDVRRSAKQIVARSISGISLVGRITITTDPEQISRLKMRSGKTLRVRYLYGQGSAGVIFHVARVHRTYDNDSGVTVELDVDTKWRDAFTIAQIIERRRAAKDDPARKIRRRQSSGLSQDTKIQYDADDIGRIYRHNVQGGFWRVVEFPAASWGTFVRLTAVTSPATEFALMLFSKHITARDLDRLVGNPLSAARPYNPQATALQHAGLIQAWGSSEQPAGYSKTDAADGYKSDGDTLTGRLEYDSSIEFAPDNGSSLFLAEYCKFSTVIHETFELAPTAF